MLTKPEEFYYTIILLRTGLISVADVIKLADNMIMKSDNAPSWCIDCSIAKDSTNIESILLNFALHEFWSSTWPADSVEFEIGCLQYMFQNGGIYKDKFVVSVIDVMDSNDQEDLVSRLYGKSGKILSTNILLKKLGSIYPYEKVAQNIRMYISMIKECG